MIKAYILSCCIVFSVFVSCKKSNNVTIRTKNVTTENPNNHSNTNTFEFAVYENKPELVDEYLYDKEERNAIKLSSNSTEWYLIDWNENGVFNEVGVDYIGVKSPFKRRPIITLLKTENTINHNEKSFVVSKNSDFKTLIETEYQAQNNLSYITDFVPIRLRNGKILDNPYKNYNKTVVYFWATWCAPCVKKLKEVHAKKGQSKIDNIRFLPIYYQCSYSDVIELNDKNGFSFEPLETSDVTALTYQLSGLPETYVFDKNGKLIAEEFHID